MNILAFFVRYSAVPGTMQTLRYSAVLGTKQTLRVSFSAGALMICCGQASRKGADTASVHMLCDSFRSSHLCILPLLNRVGY